MISPASNPTIEQRVASLEEDVRHVNKRIDGVLQEVDETDRAQTEALHQEQRERTAEDTLISKRLEALGTGGFHISAIGALWLFVGVTLSTQHRSLRSGSDSRFSSA
jgi:hypothetical protein